MMRRLIAASVAIALLVGPGGCGSGQERVSDEAGAALRAAEGKLLVAVSTAATNRLLELRGKLSPEDPVARYPWLAMAKLLDAVAGEKRDAMVTVYSGEEKTLGAALGKIANDVADYWPEELSELDRVRESLSS